MIRPSKIQFPFPQRLMASFLARPRFPLMQYSNTCCIWQALWLILNFHSYRQLAKMQHVLVHEWKVWMSQTACQDAALILEERGSLE